MAGHCWMSDSSRQRAPVASCGTTLLPGPYLRDGASFQQSLHLDAQREAVHLWSQTEAADVQLPLLIPDPEHGRALSRVTSALEKYVENSLVAFLTGDRDESQIDAFVSELRSAGVERAIAIYSELLDRQQESE